MVGRRSDHSGISKLTDPKPKISFNTSPKKATPEEDLRQQQDRDAERLHDAEAAHFEKPATAMEPMSDADPLRDAEPLDDVEPLFDRAEWEENLTRQAAHQAMSENDELGPADLEKRAPQAVQAQPMQPVYPRMKAAMPKAPGFAATGLMAPQEVGFLQRNSVILTVGAAVVLTFILGISTAVWVMGDGASQQQARFSDPVLVQDVAGATTTPQPVQDDTATRAVSPDLTKVVASSVPAEAVTPSLDNLGAAVLAGLRPKPQVDTPETVEAEAKAADALELLSRGKLRMLREGVLAKVYSVEKVEKNGVTRVRLRTINTELSSEYSAEYLVSAVKAGRVELSNSLLTPEGVFDVDTMMFSLVQDSLFADHNSISNAAALGMSRKVFQASTARTRYVGGQRVYTVQEGDSLAYIALQFYGMPNEYKRILEANRATLQSPDQIQLGQRLIIPS